VATSKNEGLKSSPKESGREVVGGSLSNSFSENNRDVVNAGGENAPSKSLSDNEQDSDTDTSEASSTGSSSSNIQDTNKYGTSTSVLLSRDQQVKNCENKNVKTALHLYVSV
jgi:hypothetical protein